MQNRAHLFCFSVCQTYSKNVHANF